MKSIRKFAAIGSVAAGVGAAIALALLPATALAHEWVWSDSKPAEGNAFGRVLAAPSAECQTALQKLADWRVADRREDMDEKLAKQAASYDPASDVKEDADEKATVKALWDGIRAACAPQTAAAVTAAPPASDACVAAKQAFKDAMAAQIAREKAEKANGTEGTPTDATLDKQEAAQLKALWDQKHAVCGSPTAPHFQKADFAGWAHHSERR
jgi:hypothetical protein